MGMAAKLVGRLTGATLVMIAACALLVSLMTASPPQGANFDLEGAITRQSPGKLTISSGENIIFHVVYDDKTAVVRTDGSGGSEHDLKVGIKVHVLGDLEESGEVKAQRIEIEGGSSPNPPPTARP